MIEEQYPLFVYGTLLTGERAHSLMAGSLDRIAPATLPNATLYNLGAYPILVDGAGRVSGEICWLRQDAYTGMLESLDGYEGPQYARKLRTVHIANFISAGEEESVLAWVYLGRKTPADSAQVPDGDWRKHQALNTP
jgi:gamma-glutamylcyclotransferase (GGCT)/AIG2-like uncharacterized protein YtfP